MTSLGAGVLLREPVVTDAAALRRASPYATPNARLVALADDLLARRGRMVDAVLSIGRGAETYEGEPFMLPTTSAVEPAVGTLARLASGPHNRP